MSLVRRFPDTRWDDGGPTRAIESLVESGLVLVFPELAFPLEDGERRFLDPRWTDARDKNISLRWPAGTLRGTSADGADRDAIGALVARFAETSERFARRLFPHYGAHMARGNTSLRTLALTTAPRSWRQDDSRLHVDAFPSNPMRGTRLLRVFTNVNPEGLARRWRVGEAFDAHAARFVGRLTRPLPGSAALLHTLGITKRRRSGYDHHMLQLHDAAKADLGFQSGSPQERVDFAPGTTWVCFSDQVPHAAAGGQHMLEQTLLVERAGLVAPEHSPLGVLERLTGRTLLA